MQTLKFLFEKATMLSLCIVEPLIAVNNRKLLNVAMVMWRCIPFALLSIYRIFRNALNNINALNFLRIMSHIFVRF
jgi:hypothetical protein